MFRTAFFPLSGLENRTPNANLSPVSVKATLSNKPSYMTLVRLPRRLTRSIPPTPAGDRAKNNPPHPKLPACENTSRPRTLVATSLLARLNGKIA